MPESARGLTAIVRHRRRATVRYTNSQRSTAPARTDTISASAAPSPPASGIRRKQSATFDEVLTPTKRTSIR